MICVITQPLTMCKAVTIVKSLALQGQLFFLHVYAGQKDIVSAR